MARGSRGEATALAVIGMILAACEAPLGAEKPPSEFLRGDWTVCVGDGTADRSTNMHFYPDSFSITTRTYSTTDGTCGAAETGATSEIWRYRLERAVPARIGAAGTEVLAREMNIENSYESRYTIVYVDEQATPNLLYFGDVGLDPLLDGSAPDKRPRLLSPSTALAGR